MELVKGLSLIRKLDCSRNGQKLRNLTKSSATAEYIILRHLLHMCVCGVVVSDLSSMVMCSVGV